MHRIIATLLLVAGLAQAATIVPASDSEVVEILPAASGNRVLPLTQEPLLMLLAAALEVIIDRAPPARARIAAAQRHVLEAIEAGDAETARSWMAKHIRDFRRGYEYCGIDLANPV